MHSSPQNAPSFCILPSVSFSAAVNAASASSGVSVCSVRTLVAARETSSSPQITRRESVPSGKALTPSEKRYSPYTAEKDASPPHSVPSA